MSELRSCAKRFGDLAFTTLPSDGPRVHLSGPAYMPSRIRSEVIVRKCTMSNPRSLLLFRTAWQQDTFAAYDQRYTFAQPAV